MKDENKELLPYGLGVDLRMPEVHIKDNRGILKQIEGNVVSIEGNERGNWIKIILDTGYTIVIPWKRIANQIVIQKVGGE